MSKYYPIEINTVIYNSIGIVRIIDCDALIFVCKLGNYRFCAPFHEIAISNTC